MTSRIIATALGIIFAVTTRAQVSISTDGSAPHASAGFEVKSTDKGVLPPRMSREAMYGIQNPVSGLLVFCTDCGLGNTGLTAVFRNSQWRSLESECLLPSVPVAGSHTITYNSVTWQWQAVPGATEFRWATSPSFAASVSLGNVTSVSESGLVCTWQYTRYLWAVNDCGRSDSVVLVATLPACPWTCNDNITDSRDNREYMTVLIGTQCWLRENMNLGTMISGNLHQKSNGIVEKYCYNDNTGNCDTYGGMYRWGEMVQYLNGASDSTTWNPAPAGYVQGICPAGWHLPARSEWNTLVNYLGGPTVSGGAMKESTQSWWAAPNTGATNSSGFTGLPGGHRHSNGSFYNYNTDGYFWTISEGSILGDYSTTADRLNLNYLSASTGFAQADKRNGYYVRCIKNE